MAIPWLIVVIGSCRTRKPDLITEQAIHIIELVIQKTLSHIYIYIYIYIEPERINIDMDGDTGNGLT
jgi:hypothetical protein